MGGSYVKTWNTDSAKVENHCSPLPLSEKQAC